jgi:hypothetical protein
MYEWDEGSLQLNINKRKRLIMVNIIIIWRRSAIKSSLLNKGLV